MGAFFNEELSFPPVHANFASSQEQLIRFSKNVHDNVHGNIYLDPVRNFNYIFFSYIKQFWPQTFCECEWRNYDSLSLYRLVLFQLALKFIDTEQFQRQADSFILLLYFVFKKNIFFELFSYLQWLLQLFYVVNDQICFSYYRLRDLKQLGKFPRGKKTKGSHRCEWWYIVDFVKIWTCNFIF